MIKFDKFFGDKKVGRAVYIILAAGIFMLAFGSGLYAPKTESIAMQKETEGESIQSHLERILSEIDGVGKVSVMIGFSEEVFSQNTGAFSMEEPEKRQSISGVLIVASGGGDCAVREKIIRATKAALAVDAHKIEVLERNV